MDITGQEQVNRGLSATTFQVPTHLLPAWYTSVQTNEDGSKRDRQTVIKKNVKRRLSKGREGVTDRTRVQSLEFQT